MYIFATCADIRDNIWVSDLRAYFNVRSPRRLAVKFLSIIVALILSSSTAYADDAEPSTGSAALLCKMSRHAQITTETLSVDYDQKLVNGSPAIFSASMITWSVFNAAGSERHELNRLTGTYNYWIEGKTSTEPMPTFVCIKMPVKF